MGIGSIFSNVYEDIKDRIQKCDLLGSKIISQIKVDIKRTSSPITGTHFKPNEAESLTNILQAVAFVFPQIGYCQGMNYVAGALYSYFLT